MVGLQHVTHVQIDAEGHDALVLEGLQKTLARRAVNIVEFEYGSTGYWTIDPGQGVHFREKRTLGGVLKWLKRLSYACFLQGNSGCLLPVSGSCFRHEWERDQRWANFVCATGAFATKMWKMASLDTDAQQLNALRALG